MRGFVSRWGWVGIVAGVGIGVSIMVGCGDDGVKPIGQNQPPETIVFLPENPDTTLYIQSLSWWGEDLDGEVTHYLFRFLYDADEWPAGDSAWITTTTTESTFYLPVTDGLAAHTFEVKAVDDDGAEDPSPGVINLFVTNSRPEVAFKNLAYMPDTTLPAISFSWTGQDSTDGNDTILEYLLWLDPDPDCPACPTEANPYVLDNLVSSYTLRPEELRHGNDRPRTVYLAAVDSGCDTSEVDSHTWFVKQPTGRILLVDDASSAVIGAAQVSDPFYRAAMDTLGEAYTLLDFETHGPFTSLDNVLPSFAPFDLVVWYTGTAAEASFNLTYAEEGIGDYLDLGGAFCLASMCAIGTDASLTFEFADQYLDVALRYQDFDIQTMWYVNPVDGSGLDTLQARATLTDVEVLTPLGNAVPLYLSENLPPADSGFVATHTELAEGGRVAFLSFAPEYCNILDNAHRQLASIMSDLLP